MTLRLADLQADRRTVMVEYGGQQVEATYQPSRVTPAFVQTASAPSYVTEALADWDLELDRSEEGLVQVPRPFVTAVARAILQDALIDAVETRGLRRFMHSGGKVIEPGFTFPWWYGLIRAARYLGVPPWELAQQPVFWREAALACEEAEASALAPRTN